LLRCLSVIEVTMSNAVVEGLFQFAILAPPLTVVVGGLLLLIKTPARKTSLPTAQTPTAHQ
jgi:hypothetical protein